MDLLKQATLLLATLRPLARRRLELELGADVLRTAVAPTWTEIGLGAIAVLRMALNFFLRHESVRRGGGKSGRQRTHPMLGRLP